MPPVTLLRSLCAVVVFFASGVPLNAAQKWAQEAKAVLSVPSRIAVAATEQATQAGAPLKYALTVQDAKGQPAAPSTDTKVQVQLLSASGQIASNGGCDVPAHSTTAQCVLQAPASGLYKIRAVPANRDIREGIGSVLILPRANKPASPPGVKQKTPAVHPGVALDRQSMQPWRRELPYRLIFAMYQPAPQAAPAQTAPAETACAAPVSHSHATILLNIDDGTVNGGAFNANLDTATVHAFFRADDAGSAPQDIHVWLSPDHGAIAPSPLIIAKCNISAEAHLSSPSPNLVSVSYSVDPSAYPPVGPPMLQARFVRGIVGIGIEPRGAQTMSLIDQAPIVAEFFDAKGDTVATDIDRTIKFVSNNSLIGPRFETISVKAGDPPADNVILPYSMGTATLFVTADGLPDATHDFQVSGLAVFIIWGVGGLLGGVLAFYAGGSKALVQRLIIGGLCGTILSWGYVFGLLPKVDAGVAHNYVSVFVVAILGGYLGIKVVEVILNRFGWLIP